MTFYEQPFYDDDVIMTSQGRFQIFLTPPVHVPYFNLSTLKVSKLYLKKCRSRPLHQFVGYITITITIYHCLSIIRKTYGCFRVHPTVAVIGSNCYGSLSRGLWNFDHVTITWWWRHWIFSTSPVNGHSAKLSCVAAIGSNSYGSLAIRLWNFGHVTITW